MTDDTSRVPKLRFPGFAGAWEQRKLGEISKTTIGEFVIKNKQDSDAPYPVYNGGTSYTGFYDEFNNEGDKIVISARGANAGFVNYIGSRFWAGNSCYSVDILDKRKFSVEFMYQFLKRNQHLFTDYQQAANIPSVSKKDVATFIVKFPTPNEQCKIGSFFKQLDHLITLHQRKLSHLRQLKKGLLQKMFPKSGEDRPEVRFPGFVDAWEQRKLSDLFIEGGSGGTPKSTNKAFYDGDIPFLGISDITKSNGFINNTEKHISSDGLNSSAAWIVSKGAISLAMYASVGKLAILNIDAATSQAFYNMIFDDYDLRDLVYQRLNKANELSEWNKLISTGTQSNLNADKVKNFQMYLPKNHDEIKLISTFFKQIDNTITLHQRKLSHLQQQKKALLQQMFV